MGQTAVHRKKTCRRLEIIVIYVFLIELIYIRMKKIDAMKKKCCLGYLLSLLFLFSMLGLLSVHGAVVTNLAVADTFILAGHPDNNAGAHTNLVIGADSNFQVQRGLLRFDLSAIPADAVIRSARLEITCLKVNITAFPVYSIHRLDEAWGEGSGTGATGTSATSGEATWSSPVFGSGSWTGGLYQAAASFSDPVFTPGPVSFQGTNLTKDVRLWVSSQATNYGCLLKANVESNPQNEGFFATREMGQPAMLIVEYDLPPVISAIAISMGTINLTVTNACSDRTNIIEMATNLIAASPWQEVTNLTTTGNTLQWQGTMPTNAASLFYRLRAP